MYVVPYLDQKSRIQFDLTQRAQVIADEGDIFWLDSSYFLARLGHKSSGAIEYWIDAWDFPEDTPCQSNLATPPHHRKIIRLPHY